MRLLIVENPLSQTFASSGHLRLFTYLMLVARSWAQKRSKRSLLAVARSRKHTAYGLNQKGRLKSTEMELLTNQTTYHSPMIYNQLLSLPPSNFFFRREIWSTLMSCQWKLKIKPKVLLMLLWEQRRCPINFKKVLTYKM
jgi:hypothetical protein